MNHQQGSDRNQMFLFSLDSVIAKDSFVRVVDAFVDAVDLKSFGFAHVQCKEEGRPPYHPSFNLQRLWGFTHANIRGKHNVLGKVGILFTGYNLSRCVSILGMDKLIRALKKGCFSVLIGIKQDILSLCGDLQIFKRLTSAFEKEKIMPLRFTQMVVMQ